MCRDCTNIYFGLVGVVGHMTNNEHQKVKDREKKEEIQYIHSRRKSHEVCEME
jgi:hypothetical protein